MSIKDKNSEKLKRWVLDYFESNFLSRQGGSSKKCVFKKGRSICTCSHYTDFLQVPSIQMIGVKSLIFIKNLISEFRIQLLHPNGSTQ